MHMFNVSTLYRQSIQLFHQNLWYELIGPRRPYLCIYKTLLGKHCLNSHSCLLSKIIFFLNQAPSCICSMCLHFVGKVHAYTKAIKGNNCLISHSCHFVKNYFFSTRLPHLYVQCLYIVKAKYQIASLKAVAGVDWLKRAPSMHTTNTLLGKNCLSSYSCHFVKKILNQTPSCICSMFLHCIGKVSNCSIKRCGKS